MSIWDNYDWDNAPLIEEDSANWLHTMGWGDLPKTGREFLEYMGWYNLGRAEQRAAVEEFMELDRAEYMPKAVRQHLVALGLLDE